LKPGHGRQKAPRLFVLGSSPAAGQKLSEGIKPEDGTREKASQPLVLWLSLSTGIIETENGLGSFLMKGVKELAVRIKQTRELYERRNIARARYLVVARSCALRGETGLIHSLLAESERLAVGI